MKNITKILGIVATISLVAMVTSHFAEASDIPWDKTDCGINPATKSLCYWLFNINDKAQQQIDLLTKIEKNQQTEIKNQQTEISELCTIVKAQGGKKC